MVWLRHAIKIAAPRDRIFRALTDLEEVAAWHVGSVEGAIAPGQVITLAPKPGVRFSWRTEKLEPDETIVQTCVEGVGTSAGKTLTFALADADDGRTVVRLIDGEWQPNDPHIAFCNTHWGSVLLRLKSHVEKA